MDALRVNTVANEDVLFLALELSNRSWRLVFGNRAGKKCQHAIEAGHWPAFASHFAQAREKLHLSPSARCLSVYEAGRDGFWIHRRLLAMGIESRVIDSASIEVNRHARRAKTDRVDGEKLLALLLAEAAGQKALRVVRVPSEEDEDRRCLHRERARLQKEHNSIVNRVHALLALQGLKLDRPGARDWRKRLGACRAHILAHRYAELERATQRLELLRGQLEALETERERMWADDNDATMAKARRLAELKAIGHHSAWVFATECFGWRQFRNRRELAAAVGLTPTPHNSGDSVREQGVSKAGNPRLRRLLVEIAWLWLQHQPDSELTRWYQHRFVGAGKRMQRIGIVALARRLLIALWRYVEHGEIPVGAVLKTASA